MREITNLIRGIFNNKRIILMIAIAILSLLLDAPKFKNKKHNKDYKIIQIISYTYIAIGLIIFALLRVG